MVFVKQRWYGRKRFIEEGKVTCLMHPSIHERRLCTGKVQGLLPPHQQQAASIGKCVNVNECLWMTKLIIASSLPRWKCWGRGAILGGGWDFAWESGGSQGGGDEEEKRRMKEQLKCWSGNGGKTTECRWERHQKWQSEMREVGSTMEWGRFKVPVGCGHFSFYSLW